MLPVVTGSFRLASDPELRFTPSGTAVTNLRLVASSRKQVDGEWQDDKTLWIDCVVFKDMALNVAESLIKGDVCVVTGKIQTEEWEKDGQKRSKISMVADEIGPSNRFRATPHSHDTTRTTGTETGARPADNDPWATPAGSDEPPF